MVHRVWHDLNMDGFTVECSGNKYDLAEFLRHHPGGVNYVEAYKEKDVTKRMSETQHSASAFYLLREYQIGGRDGKKNEDSEDLEELVDWNKPMLHQVAKLGTRYAEWVISPVDRELRLFGNPILESITITPWYLVPLVWIPVVLYYIFDGYHKYTSQASGPISIVPISFYIALGVVLWSLIEYSLHRWVFHLTPSGKSKAMIYIHFAIHGLHHKVPFDTRRLVIPPIPAALVVYVGYQLFSRIFAENVLHLVVAGGILGYVIYDMIHFYLHSGAPKEGTYLYNMKRYHNQHHFAQHDTGFGISTPGWDKLFGTVVKLRKLGMGIKWK